MSGSLQNKRRRAAVGDRGDGPSSVFGAPGTSMLQWTEKYAPRRRTDLIVRKNKVQEFAEFLESMSHTACVLSGSSGCGKSALIRVVAMELGMEVVEYVAKIQQQRISASLVLEPGRTRYDSYESKLDSYESFCSRAWMNTLEGDGHVVGGVSSSFKRKTLVVLDDLPTVVGEDQERRLVNATLGLVARSSKVVLVVTETSSKDSAEHYSTGGSWESSSIPKALTLALEKFCSPLILSLNPIPKATMVKHLGMICDREGVAISRETLQTMADLSQGDLSSAILGLQFAARGIAGDRSRGDGTGGTDGTDGTSRNASRRRPAPRRKGACETAGEKQVEVVLSHLVRDASLSLFHGLGKLLYNKRLPCPTSSGGIQRNAHDRPPMDGFDPEETVHASGLSGPSVTAFLHENILDFIDAEHIEDVAQCLDHISRADVLSSAMDFTPYFGTEQDEPDGARGLQDMLSSIVASRGVCYWNFHPAPRSWKPLKAPVAFKVERGRRTNGLRARQAASVNRVEFGGAVAQTCYMTMTTEVLPFVRAMGHKEVRQQPPKWDRYWQGACVECENWRSSDGLIIEGIEGIEDPIEN